MKEEPLIKKGDLDEDALVYLLDMTTRRYLEQSAELNKLRETSLRIGLYQKKPWWRFWK